MLASFLWQFALDAGVNPPADVKWTAIRMHRAQLLQQSDWAQLPDAPLDGEEKAVWAAYR